MPEHDDFMTVAEVASILKLNQQTVRNWIDSGKLPALHIGRRVRIRRTDFNALLEASVIGERQPAGPSIWDGNMPAPQVPNEI
jgi:excisionase family DNA binding protein